MNTTWSRRNFLRNTAAGMGGAVVAGGLAAPAFAQNAAAAQPPADPKFLIVLACSGGASLVDSFMAVRESECVAPAGVNAYPEALVKNIEGSPFRAVDYSGRAIGAIPQPFTGNQSNFVKKHHKDMMVVTMTGTSVNHGIAEHRSVNGNGAWKGRTLQEAVALTYGAGRPIPNVGLVSGVTFADRGSDATMPSYAYTEAVTAPNVWPLSLDGYRGIPGAPARNLFDAARQFRNERIDPRSDFAKTFGAAQRVQDWEQMRGAPLKGVESADLITKLMLFADSPDMPLTQSGLQSSSLGQKVREAFPAYQTVPLDAQAALAFLLLRYGISVTVTLGPDLNALLKGNAKLGFGGLAEGDLVNTPVGFDFSHNDVRATQSYMWTRTLTVVDRLITLLKAEEYKNGESYWDRTMIYCATEFGRTRNRPNGAMSFGAGHDLNNGFLVISPLVNGNTVQGGVDTKTILTYGFDPATGRPDPNRTMTEQHVYAGLIQALGIETPGAGLPDMRSMRKNA